jgi:hypothetical protein
MMATLPWLQALSPDLTRSHLIVRLIGVLQFATTNIQELDRNAKLWSEDLDPYVNVADKAIIETVLLILIASRISNPPDEIRSLIRDLVCQLSPMIRTERNRALLMRYPHTAAALGIGHIILTRLGNHDDEFDYLVRRALASGHVEAVERLPYRIMDVQWLRGLIDPGVPPDFDNILPHSILLSGAHPIHMSAPDTYALTHALMYITDFGTNALPSSVDEDHISALVDAALAYHLLSENFDLLGELLMSFAILGRSCSPYARFGWCLLTTVWDQLGFLPSPTFDASAYSALTGDEASSYVFRHLYHTTYVGGMLCAIMLSRAEIGSTATWIMPRWNDQELLNQCEHAVCLAFAFCQTQQHDETIQKTPQQTFAAESQNKVLSDVRGNSVDLRTLKQSDIDALISHIREYPGRFGCSTAPWGEVLSDLPLSREELVLVLTDALLIYAIQDYKLPVLVEILSFVASLDIPLSKTFREAVVFLRRQQLPCGAIGAHFVSVANRKAPEAIDITTGLGRCLVLITRRLQVTI